ncbi:TrkA family potassium uptake protein [Coprothermobacteraceae bacterium]|nr:TrkA family potassium uptake protein [Coprothermobacteraceae bacterium]
MAKKSIAVFGLGRFGAAFAKTAAQLGHEVIGIDKDDAVVKELSQYLLVAAQADLYKLTPKDLVSLGVKNVDLAMVALSQMDLSILVCMELIESGIKVVARADDELHAKILRKIGVEKVIMPATESGVRAAYQLLEGHIFDVLGIYTDLVLAEVRVPQAWVGKKLRDLQLPARNHLIIVGIKTKDDFILGNPDYVLSANEIVLLAGKTKDVYAFLNQQR